MGGLLATLGHGDIWSWTAAKGHVWVHGSVAASICADVMTPVTTEGRAAAWVWAPTWGHVGVQGPPSDTDLRGLHCHWAHAAAEGHIWVRGLLQLESVLMFTAPVTTVAYVSHVLNLVLKHEGHAELTPPLTGMGNADPIP